MDDGADPRLLPWGRSTKRKGEVMNTFFQKNHRKLIASACGVGAALALAAAPKAGATGGISFIDRAAELGIEYSRVPSPADAVAQALYEKADPVQNPGGTYTFLEDVLHNSPIMTRLPGVAVLDYDNDGDEDIFVTNGPGAAKSLFKNFLREEGQLRFEDVAAAAGVAAPEMASSGVAYADTDNDGDLDLLLVGENQPNRFFKNRGDGTFEDATALSGLGLDSGPHMSASFGDVDGDGLVDLAIANGMTRESLEPCFFFRPEHGAHNQLFLNRGNNQFVEATLSSGIYRNRGFKSWDPMAGALVDRPDLEGTHTISWAVAMVDYDFDGDLDVVFADDQCGLPPAKYGAIYEPPGDQYDGEEFVDRGFLHVFENDGAGNFNDVSPEIGLAGTGAPFGAGAWMGLAFADFDYNGVLDIFGTNFGDYAFPFWGPYEIPDQSTRPFFGVRAPDGTVAFEDPSVGDRLKATVFGWGTAAFDYDNDGRTDVVYQGGLDVNVQIIRDNPGALLRNVGPPAGGDPYDIFEYDLSAFEPGLHTRRNDIGLAIGDLDDDGFFDLVTVASAVMPDDALFIPFPVAVPSTNYGSVMDATAFFVPRMFPNDPNFDPTDPRHIPPAQFLYNGLVVENGTLAVEMSDGNGNHWVKVRARGSKSLTPRGAVNRDGIGAVFAFTPYGGKTSISPVLGGSSFVSQHSLTLGFGLGSASHGTLEVLWPGGVRNRLYHVGRSERVLFPEIPCSIDGAEGWGAYLHCLHVSLNDLKGASVLSAAEKARFFLSAVLAYAQEH